MKNTFTIMTLILATMLAGCKTVQVADLKPKNPIANKLPSLEPLVHIGSFEAAYSLGTTVGSAGMPGMGGSGVMGAGSILGYATAFTDRRIQDAIVLFEREVRDNITLGGNTTIGSAVGRILTGETKVKGWGWYAASLVTLTIPNLFGMPFCYYQTELELEVEIRDCNENTIGRYQGYGRRHTTVALWHGYGGAESPQQITGNEGAARMSNINAIKMAMDDIKTKIDADAPRLRQELEACRK